MTIHIEIDRCALEAHHVLGSGPQRATSPVVVAIDDEVQIYERDEDGFVTRRMN